MLVADSSVWIDFFGGKTTRTTDRLDSALGANTVLLIDVIVTEVLQGVRDDRQFTQLVRLFDKLPLLQTGGFPIAIEAASNYRRLRLLGMTVRKTIDTLIATNCIAARLPLLYDDRDFDPFVEHLGLVSAMETV